MFDWLLDRLDTMVGSFDDDKFDAVIKHIERLGAVGILFAGAAGLVRHAEKVTPFLPALSFWLGIVSIIGTFIFIVIVAAGAWHASRQTFARPWLGHFLGLSIFILCILLSVGGMFWAI